MLLTVNEHPLSGLEKALRSGCILQIHTKTPLLVSAMISLISQSVFFQGIATDNALCSNFASLLDARTLQSLANVYFRCCHQQPYSYFDEDTFRQDLENGSLPYYLLLAFVATAVRFSSDFCFTGRHIEVMDWCSRMAWFETVKQSFSDSHSLDIRTVQATNMLGVVDYVGMLGPSILVALFC
jgi:hypothetical protein